MASTPPTTITTTNGCPSLGRTDKTAMTANKSYTNNNEEEEDENISYLSNAVVSCSSRSMSITQESSERDSEDCYADVGFMFDGLQKSTLKRFLWGPTSSCATDTSSCKTTENDTTNKEAKTTTTTSTTRAAASTKKTIPVVRVALHVVDDEPGALQSGHYLWPAAPALAEYLMQVAPLLQTQPASLSSSSLQLPGFSNPRNVLELGAGSALVSLTSLQLFQESLQCLVITDHDPGTLERARDNYETTLEDLLEAAETEEDQMDCINGVASIPVLFESLEWSNTNKDDDGDGDDDEKMKELSRIAVEHNSHALLQDDDDNDDGEGFSEESADGSTSREKKSTASRKSSFSVDHTLYDAERNIFDLILGSDLIYSCDVVEPLFRSVSKFMTSKGSFLLSQSLALDETTESKLETICSVLNLERRVLTPKTDVEHGTNNKSVRIEQFTWKRNTP